MIEFAVHFAFHHLPIALTSTAITLLFIGENVALAAIPLVIGMALIVSGRMFAHWLSRPSSR